MPEPTAADVPGMLLAAIDLATAGSGRLAPAHLPQADVEQAARHFGAAGCERTLSGWRFRCPADACGGWDFGPTLPIGTYVRTWLHGGRLPGGVLGGAACLDCGHITAPRAVDVPFA